jgi:hypothetical protein
MYVVYDDAQSSNDFNVRRARTFATSSSPGEQQFLLEMLKRIVLA